MIQQHHEKDIEYFMEYPAPLMELIQSAHFTNINSTLPFWGLFFYFLVRALGCEQVLEIGHAEGYSSFYLAHGVKDNGVRFGMAGNHYYGIDIVQTDTTRYMLEKHNLPVTIMNMDSMTITPETFKDIKFDLIFQDGNHDTPYVLHELEVLYPQLKPGGIWVFHDAAGPAEEAFHKMIKDSRYKFEFVRFIDCYGIAFMRKVEGVDPDKLYWYDRKSDKVG